MNLEIDFKSLLGDFDPAAPPPTVDPVPPGVPRPRWSVMIPTFNCAHYLRETLQSVLAQDPGEEHMQIEVIDDCSTKDDPEAVVTEIGKGRVTFHRKPQNEGAIPNFNTCIERSRGELVHILHGDDYVLPGFYQEIAGMAERHSTASLLAVRSVFVNEEGRWDTMNPWIPELTTPSNITKSFIYGNPLQFAGVVIRRSFFEQFGGFREELIHTADWEMWERAVEKGSGVVSEGVLAAYRVFATNDTGRLMRTGENLIDRIRLTEVFASRIPDFPTNTVVRRIANLGIEQEERFRASGDLEAAAANRRTWQAIGGIEARLLHMLRKPMRRISRILN